MVHVRVYALVGCKNDPETSNPTPKRRNEVYLRFIRYSRKKAKLDSQMDIKYLRTLTQGTDFKVCNGEVIRIDIDKEEDREDYVCALCSFGERAAHSAVPESLLMLVHRIQQEAQSTVQGATDGEGEEGHLPGRGHARAVAAHL